MKLSDLEKVAAIKSNLELLLDTKDAFSGGRIQCSATSNGRVRALEECVVTMEAIRTRALDVLDRAIAEANCALSVLGVENDAP